MFGNIYQNKRVLITGHTGFKGSWLSLWLKKLGADVCGVSLEADTNPAHSRLLNIDLHSEICDIRDLERLSVIFDRFQPEIVFHLAAQPLVRRSYAEPVETFEANIMGSIYLMDAIRTLGKPCTAVMITSDKCYENVGKPEGYVETDPMGGHDPYSASKGCAELAVSSYRRSFFPGDRVAEHGIRLASVRAGNVIGGGDWAEDRIIPDAVRAVTSDKALEIRSPHAVRPWQHVLEPLSGYLLLAERLMQGEDRFADGWNFGPYAAEATTVSEIIDLFYKIWGEGKAEYDKEAPKLHEAAFLTLSSEKVMREMGWKPTWSLLQNIDRTANWYKEFYAGEDARELTLADIDAYMEQMEY